MECESGYCERNQTSKIFLDCNIDDINNIKIPLNAIFNNTLTKCKIELICTNKQENTMTKLCNNDTDCISGRCVNFYYIGCGTNNGIANQGCQYNCGCKIDCEDFHPSAGNAHENECKKDT